MKIAILGAGNVGGALGKGWAKRGHQVQFGSRTPQSQEMIALLSRCGSNASAAKPAVAAAFGDVVVCSLPWPATESTLKSLNLRGKTLLDCTNPLKEDLSGLEVGTTNSGGEMVAAWAPGANVVKIFNSTGFENMENSSYRGGAPAMFYCGGDATAKSLAAGLAKDLGFDPVDAGPLSNSRVLEPLAMLWIWLAIPGGAGRDIAFQLLRR